MADTIRIRPRPGIILAGIPAAGTDVPRELAEEWLAAGLAVEIAPPAAPEAAPVKKPARPAKEG